MKNRIIILFFMISLILIPLNVRASGYISKEIDIKDENIKLNDIEEANVEINLTEEVPVTIKAKSLGNNRVIFRTKIISDTINTTYFYCDSEEDNYCKINTRIHYSFLEGSNSYRIAIEFIDYDTYVRENNLPDDEIDSNISLFKEVDYKVINKIFSNEFSIKMLFSDSLIFIFTLLTIVQVAFMIYLLYKTNFKITKYIEARRTYKCLITSFVISFFSIVSIAILMDNEISFIYFIIDFVFLALYIVYNKLITNQFELNKKGMKFILFIIYNILISLIQLIAINTELFIIRMIIFTIFNLFLAINSILSIGLVQMNKNYNE